MSIFCTAPQPCVDTYTPMRRTSLSNDNYNFISSQIYSSVFYMFCEQASTVTKIKIT